MAVVTFSNATFTAGAASANARVILHTAVADAVMLLFSVSNETSSLSAVTVAGTPATRLGTFVFNNGGYLTELWGLTAPASGTLTISAIHVGNTPSLWAFGACTYTGHRTTATPFGGVVTSGVSTSATASIAVSATLEGLAVAMFGKRSSGGISAGAGTTVRFSATLSTAGCLFVGDAAGDASVTLSAFSGVTDWGMIGIHLISSPSVAAALVIPHLSLLGCGV